jgi:hypothetical protein
VAFLTLLLLVSLFIFANSLYYTVALVRIVVILLFSLVTSLQLSTLTMLMLCIVYIGAIIILIGYVCAVCPNVLSSRSFVLNSPFLLVMSIFTFNLFLTPTRFVHNTPMLLTIVEFFYSTTGFFTFLILILMLFLTLLIVTSQYSVPKGPFRSTSI